jgi:hypothetical protein
MSCIGAVLLRIMAYISREIVIRVHYNMGCTGLRSWSSRLRHVFQHFTPCHVKLYRLYYEVNKGTSGTALLNV